MATIFLSHSSGDDHLASQLEAWLTSEGFDDLFVDHTGIRGGDRWTEALRRAKGTARVVLCLVTPRWLTSDECFGEFIAAWYAGQRIVPLLADTSSLDERQRSRLRRVLGEDQGVDLSPALTDGHLHLDETPIAEPLKAGLRAAGALAKIGLDPEAFEIDLEICPAPFLGLQSFGDSDSDAAIFYGRSPEIARCLEDLRGMRASGVRQPYAVVGASGSGKSSLLKAGILPRLRRERAWIVLRTFRVGAAPLLNLAEAIRETFAQYGEQRPPGTIRDRLRASWETVEKHEGYATEDGLSALRTMLEREFLAPLRQRANRPDATVLIALDQAEELARAIDQDADVLSDYLRAALLPAPSADRADAPAVGALIALTARSDSFAELQAAPRFAGLDTRCSDIRPVPLHRFADAFEKPAARYGVQIEPGLVDTMVAEAPAADALPLFALAMEELWRQYSAAKRIRREDYDTIGRLDGIIDRTAERALLGIRPNEDRPIERSISEERDKLAARTFVPFLVQLSETGEPIRRVARLDEIDAEARELLASFLQWRLLVAKELARANRSGNGDEGTTSAGHSGVSTVEVAHEAIFRGWHRFKGWLEPLKADLETLRGLETAARVWDRHGRERVFLDHRSHRLKAAKRLLDHFEFKNKIGTTERAYLDAASGAQRRGNVAALGIATAFLALLVTVLMWRTYEFSTQNKVTWYGALRVWAVKAGFTSLAPPEMIELSGGTFIMGSPENDHGHIVRESPQHEVKIPRAFAIGKYEVTFDDWMVCALAGGCDQRLKDQDQHWGGGRRPVINIGREDAEGYVRWLNKVTGDTYRLPSEAEWEYAARARTTKAYAVPKPDGSDDIAGKGFANCDGCGSDGDNEGTVPVGSFPPNAFGLHDMHGNVWELVEDCLNESYEGAPDDGSAWRGGNCDGRVLRGGSWYSKPEGLRSRLRMGLRGQGGETPGYRDDYGDGFRVARTLR